MKYRSFKDVDKKVSLLGFGTMRLPLNEDKSIDQEETFRMLDYAYTSGVNYYDTAWFYHDGASEGVLGKWLKTIDRDSVYIADKLPIWYCKTKEEAIELFNTQFQRLGVTYIDNYLVHALNRERWDLVKQWGLMEFLEEARKDGKIGAVGFSFHGHFEEFDYIINDYPWEFCQIQLNYLDIAHQQGLKGYKILEEKGIPAIIMEPLKGGKLSKFADDIEAIFKEENPQASISSWSLKWLANLPMVKIVLSGMSAMEHVQDNINTLSDHDGMTPQEMLVIEKVVGEIRDRSKVNCTACDYCMPCPFGVNIPANFKCINDYGMYKEKGGFKWNYGILKDGGFDASQCVACGVCLDKCPQNIDIPTELKKVLTLSEELN